MDLLHALVLAVIQGFTEFLPISSSAHLILLPRLFGWEDQGLAFDVAVHVGTLSAVVSYFRHEIRRMSVDWACSLMQRRTVGESRLAWAVLLGTIPVGLAGLFLGDFIETALRSPLVIAVTTIAFGILLWLADVRGRRTRSEHELTWGDVLFIGCAQAVALIPGTSRSGITMTAALLLGLNRAASARFSFLLSIPVIVLAGGLKGLELLEGTAPVDWMAIAVGVACAGVTAYLVIFFFMRLIERTGMLPYVIYRFVLGAWLFYLFA